MKVRIEINGVSSEIEDENVQQLDNALQLIDQALKGVGYCFKGNIKIVED